ncbi:DUF885 family protein [Sphingomonas changnyeongensis]|uniref:DUF885 family protein n=1 Tax=Sphingomonas changnyeongensis TaxID=2698679 RepID=A0A7Z2S8N7_9SPHN|nr:DUF885 family protein [Sphingomonas changnyeongensis]QHL91606.1 DUF885 family protein [Sphingomonas changnyeongensis]
MKLVILAAMAVLMAPPALAAQPDTLESLFTEWRQLQKGEVRGGAPDFTAPALARQAAALKQLRARLDRLPAAQWSIARKVDRELIRSEMNGLDFDLRVAQPWRRDPAWYISVWTAQSDTPAHEGPVHPMPVELWTYSFPLDAAAQTKLAGELAHIPALLAQARGNLTGNTRDLWKASIVTIGEQLAALEDLQTKVAGGDPALRRAVDAATGATRDFLDWVKAEAPKKTGPSGVGKAEYSWFLKHVQRSPLTWEDEVAILQRELDRAHAALRMEEHRNRALPPLTGAQSPADYDRQARAAVDKYLRFMDERQILTVRDYMKPALLARIGSYVPPEQQNFFHIAMHRAPMTLWTHFYHWWDLANMAADPHPSAIRRGPLLYNVWLSRAEGMATAMEELMLNAGLFDDDPRAREIVWIMQAQRAARGLASLYAQANMIDLDAAMAMQVSRTPNGWMSPNLPLLGFEQQMYLRLPGYGPSYITGKAMIERLITEVAEKRGKDFRVKDFFDELNSYGMIPVPLIRWQMLGATDELDKIGVSDADPIASDRQR